MGIRAKRWTLFFLSFWLLALGVPQSISAKVPYVSNTWDKYGNLIWIQSTYEPAGVIGLDFYVDDPKHPGELKHSPLVNPENVFIDGNDDIYITDTGNNRIVHLDSSGALIRMIDVPSSPLKKPHGLYVSNNGEMYIADTGNQRILKLDREGQPIRQFLRPDSPYLPKDYKFDPINLVVDKRGFMYITVLDGYQGLLQLDPEGQFQSFYGANKTVVSLADILKRKFYTEEQLAREMRKLPETVRNVAIDRDGFIYTTSIGVSANQIKKLNIRGVNIFKNIDFGTTRSRTKPRLVDITVDSNYNITAIDQANKVVSQYDANGNLLFFWYGRDDLLSAQPQLGIMERMVSIASNSANDLFILDGHNNMLQRFSLTEFGNLIHQATRLMMDGYYQESKPYWEKTLRLNANYTLAYSGLARAAYHMGDYKEALDYFRLAGDHHGYSDAFWQLRLQWFQKYFALFANTTVILAIVYFAASKFMRRKKRKINLFGHTFPQLRLVVQLRHAFYILRHPLDGFEAIRHEGKGSLASSFILLAAAMISLTVQTFSTSFSFHPVYAGSIRIADVLIQFSFIWLSWIISNYLISSIYQGEGRFRDVIAGNAYALMPVIVIGIPLALLSNVFTLHEAAIYNFIFYIMVIWSGLLVFWQVQAIQNYTFGEAIINLLLSCLTMILIWVLLFIIFGLGSEFFDFLQSVYKEVSIR